MLLSLREEARTSRIEAHIIEPLGAYDIVDLESRQAIPAGTNVEWLCPQAWDTCPARLDNSQVHFFDKDTGESLRSRPVVEMAHVKLDDVTKTFAGNCGLDNVTLEIEDGQFFVLLGPFGAGKTTTLRLIAGLDGADSDPSSMAGMSIAGVPRNATWHSSCSNTRFIHAIRCGKIWSFRSSPRRGVCRGWK